MLVLKLALVPLLIFLITLAGRRWGPRVAGALSAFPVVAGPILLFLALEQGEAFAADAALGTVAAVAAFAAYALAYAWLATRFGWVISLAGAYVVYAVVAFGASLSSLPVLVHAALDVLVLIAFVRWMPRDLPPAPPPRAVRAELLLRMACGAALVVLITWLAETLGPRVSGVLALFPVLGTVLAVFSHRNSGVAFVVALLRGMLLGMFSMTAFCATLALSLPHVAPALAFPLAVGVALITQFVVYGVVSRGERMPVRSGVRRD